MHAIQDSNKEKHDSSVYYDNPSSDYVGNASEIKQSQILLARKHDSEGERNHGKIVPHKQHSDIFSDDSMHAMYSK